MADYELVDIVYIIAFVLVIVGGLNWGASALNYNLVDKLFGQGSSIGSIVYYLVALSALLLVVGFASKRIHFTKEENCMKKSDCPSVTGCGAGKSCQPISSQPSGSANMASRMRMMRR
jgi:uncharacterized membrane protein YuzA (DUF378 family)